MGQRQEPRTEIKLPVRIFGTDADGKVFSENAFTIDISRTGAKIMGVHARIKPGEIIGITHGTKKSRFTVKWAGTPGSPREGQIGVINISPEKEIWDTNVATIGIDNYKTTSANDRREHPRMKCVNSVQLHPEGQAAPIWGKAIDLSTGGCFVEMSMPLEIGTRLKIALWLSEKKLMFNGKVVNSRPGFGIGVQFVQIQPQEIELLRAYLKSITQIR